MRPDVLRGHLDALILAVLEGGPLHGYEIMEEMLRRSGGELDLNTGTIYPALRRLERATYVVSEWNAVNGRQRRTYQLTAAGRRALAIQRSEWRAFADVIERLLYSNAAA